MARGVASHNTWKCVSSIFPLWQNRRFHWDTHSRRWRLPLSQRIFTHGKHSEQIIILCSNALVQTNDSFLAPCTGIQYKCNLWKLKDCCYKNYSFFVRAVKPVQKLTAHIHVQYKRIVALSFLKKREIKIWKPGPNLKRAALELYLRTILKLICCDTWSSVTHS
jgi:hypothetical protein